MNTSPFVVGFRPTGLDEAHRYTANRKINWKVLDFVKCGGLRTAMASHGTSSWAVGLVRPLYPANSENEAPSRLFPQPVKESGWWIPTS